jgi:hypothetical protein
MIEHFPNHLITFEMAEKIVLENPRFFRYVPTHLMNYNMAENAIKQCSYLLTYVPYKLKKKLK